MEEIESGNIKVISVIVDDLPFAELPVFLRAKLTKRLRLDSEAALNEDIGDVAAGLAAAMIIGFNNRKEAKRESPDM